MAEAPFEERDLVARPIRDLGLRIEGTVLEPVVQTFLAEVDRLGLPFRPRLYLSTEWGVPMGTIAIAVPFYLARPELAELHARRTGHLEGAGATDILRYLRHELGHVIAYAYKLYETESWTQTFGAMTQPYVEEYRPEPFSRRFVRHLPGWYAQKHPDEDWAETFAVWMTPGLDWRADYAQLPTALTKLEFCASTLAELGGRDPLVTSAELDEDVSGIDYSLEQYYRDYATDNESGAAGLEGDLRAIFDDLNDAEASSPPATLSAADLMRRLERDLMAAVFRWTGHFPEKTRTLVRDLAKRAEALKQVYPASAEDDAIVSVTAFVTSLAMNFVHRGAYFPETPSPSAAAEPAPGAADTAPESPPRPTDSA